MTFNSGVEVPNHLAYVEWFTAFQSTNPHHRMYTISRSKAADGTRLVSVIPAANIQRSIHLFPVFGHVAPASWSSSNVLDSCRNFLVNPFMDSTSYRVVY
jgi:hypothetical protein